MIMPAAALLIVMFYYGLTITQHIIYSDKISEPVRLVVLSDLRSHSYGDLQQNLVNRITEQNPDAILMTGDIMDSEIADDVVAVTGNYDTAGTLLKNYKKKQYIMQVKRNLYVAMNLADKQPVANKFHIASKITPTSYVSHHAAFEYYGCANQVSYQVEVSSETPFTALNFDGITYSYLASRIIPGVTATKNGVRVTDIERTIIDNINDFQKVVGLEELLRCIALVPSIKEDKLLTYLANYNKQFLYQKAGYILRHFQQDLNISEDFFKKCAQHIGKSTRYLSEKRNGEYVQEWRLVAPTNLMSLTMKGRVRDTDIATIDSDEKSV